MQKNDGDEDYSDADRKIPVSKNHNGDEDDSDDEDNSGNEGKMQSSNNHNGDEDNIDDNRKKPARPNNNDNTNDDNDNNAEDEDNGSYYDAEEAEEAEEADDDKDDDKDNCKTVPPQHVTAGASNAFLSFFADGDNYEDEEEEPLPINDSNAICHAIVSGGPVKPNYASMTVADANMAREQYKKEPKRYANRQ